MIHRYRIYTSICNIEFCCRVPNQIYFVLSVFNINCLFCIIINEFSDHNFQNFHVLRHNYLIVFKVNSLNCLISSICRYIPKILTLQAFRTSSVYFKNYVRGNTAQLTQKPLDIIALI